MNLDEVTPSEESKENEMKIEFDEEIKPTGEGASEPEWRYVEATRSTFVVAGSIRLHPHWNGLANTDEIRAVVRKAAAADALYGALHALKASGMLKHACKHHADSSGRTGACPKHEARTKAFAALALVDGPQTKETE